MSICRWMLRFLFCILLLSSGDTGGCSPLGPASLSSAGLLPDDVEVDVDVDLGLPALATLVDGVAAVAWGLLAPAGASSVGTLGCTILIPLSLQI